MVTIKRTGLMILLTLAALQGTLTSHAQFAYQDRWYQNPLGFKPVKLHTRMGFMLPAAVAGITLLVFGKDTAIQKRLSVYTEPALTFGYKYPFTKVAQTSTGLNLFLRKWLAVGAEYGVTVPFDAYNDAVGFSIRPFARFYAINTQRWKLWFESGGGLLYFTGHFPKPTPADGRTGTHLNGTTKYGIGASVLVSEGMSLVLGARHLHISNGNSKGTERNPSHDSNGLFAGLSWEI